MADIADRLTKVGSLEVAFGSDTDLGNASEGMAINLTVEGRFKGHGFRDAGEVAREGLKGMLP